MKLSHAVLLSLAMVTCLTDVANALSMPKCDITDYTLKSDPPFYRCAQKCRELSCSICLMDTSRDQLRHNFHAVNLKCVKDVDTDPIFFGCLDDECSGLD